MVWLVYILLCDQKTFYVGITSDLPRRLTQHQNKYSPSTKKFSNIKLVYKERYEFYADAEKREKQLKGWSVAKKRALIDDNRDLLITLSKSREIGDSRDRLKES